MDQPPSLPETETTEPKPATMSLAARMLNVFAVPGEVFEAVRAARASTANWLVPVVLFAIVGALSAVIIFSQPAIVQQIREQQQKAFDQQVKSGKMSQAQEDQITAMMDKFMGPNMLKIFGAVAAVVVAFVRVLWWAFVLWLLARLVLRVQVDFVKTLEVAGLATMIVVLGAIVGVLLTVNLSRLGEGLSLALAIKDFDLNRKSHLFAGAVNVFSFWQIAVTSIGLGKLARVPFLRAAWVVFAYWVIQENLLIIGGLGQWAL